MRYFVLFLITFAQLSFAVISVMFVIFSAAAIVNTNDISHLQDFIFTLFLVLIPLSSFIIAPTVLYLGLKKSAKLSYWWHMFPVLLTVIYCLYIIQFD